MNISRSRMPDLAQLQAFEAAARYESFTLAATELNLSQSAISRQIKELEAQLGLSLFARVRQRVILSDSGRRMLADVQRLLGLAEDMTLRALGTSGLSGVLTVAAMPTFGSRWLIPRLPGFLAGAPGIQVSLSSRATPFDFETGPFDLAIHYGRPSWPHATCTFLCSEVVVPVAAPGLAPGPAMSAQAVADLPLLHLTPRPRLWAQWFEREAAGPHSAGRAYHGHRFESFSMVIAAAIAGMGVALVPTYLIEEDIASGRLVVVADLSMPTDQAYYVAVPEGKTSNPLAVSFQTWLATQVGRPVPARTRPGQGVANPGRAAT